MSECNGHGITLIDSLPSAFAASEPLSEQSGAFHACDWFRLTHLSCGHRLTENFCLILLFLDFRLWRFVVLGDLRQI